ncbi:uncharacterized protein ISCGN_011404 [Ixodes scapularis]
MAAFTVNDGGLTGRIKWTDEATLYMLNLIRDLNAVEMLASKRQRNKRTFMTIQDRMFRLGHDWSWQQIRCHWKNLKSRYNHERRFAQKGQQSYWKHYDLMNALLKQRSSSGGRTSQELTDSSCADSHTENGEGYDLKQQLRPNGRGTDEYIVPTSEDASPSQQSFTGFSIESAVPTNTALTDLSPATLNIKEETPDEDVRYAEANGDDAKTALTQSVTDGTSSVTESQQPDNVSRESSLNSPNPSPPVERTLAELDVSPPQTTRQLGEIVQSSPRFDPRPFYRNRKRITCSWAVSSAAERKAKLELDILVSTKRKLEAETLKAEAEERRATAETLLLAETLKKCSEEKNKAVAEAMFLVQERKRSEEETRKAAAIADFHVEERRKAAAKVDVLLEHRNYYADQRKTEAVKRRVLLLEVQKMKRELKLI